jgi:hypothetical protein
MKKIVFIFASLLLLSTANFAQEKVNLVVFSEDGDAFFAFVNGVRQNDKAETNIKVTGLSPNLSLRIEFENKALPQLKQAYPLEPGFEHTFRIKRDMKKQLKIRYFGQTALNDASSTNVATVPYHTEENPITTSNSTPINSTSSGNGNTTVQSSTVTSSTNVGTKGDPNNVSVNINVGGMGMNMNMNGMDEGTTTTTTSKTVTTSSNSSSSYINSNNLNQSTPETNTAPASKAVCSVAMSAASFSKLKQSVEAKPFSDTKMSTAKVATKNSCLSIAQVTEICKLFSMDDDKLIYAKYAYAYCVDKANYYQVSEVFSFSSSTDELNKFLEQ